MNNIRSDRVWTVPTVVGVVVILIIVIAYLVFVVVDKGKQQLHKYRARATLVEKKALFLCLTCKAIKNTKSLRLTKRCLKIASFAKKESLRSGVKSFSAF